SSFLTTADSLRAQPTTPTSRQVVASALAAISPFSDGGDVAPEIRARGRAPRGRWRRRPPAGYRRNQSRIFLSSAAIIFSTLLLIGRACGYREEAGLQTVSAPRRWMRRRGWDSNPRRPLRAA